MKYITLAAIDIGSNAIRLMINNVEQDTNSVEYKKTAFLRVPVRLGEDTFGEGKIGKEKFYLLNEALKGFSHIMKAYGVEHYMACATSAMRDAANGQEVVKRLYKNSGIEVNIISGKEEAEMIVKAGGLNTVPDISKNYLYVDVGGGSTEIIIYSRQQKKNSHSFQIGTVRMLANGVSVKEKESFRQWLTGIYKKYGSMNIIASGGNINKVYKLLKKKEKEPLYYNEVKNLYTTLSSMTIDERMEKYKLNIYRADVIIPAMEIFLTVGEICKVREIFVPKAGVVDGMIHTLYQSLKNTSKPG